MSEIEEVETFIAEANFPGVKANLQEYLSTLTKKAKIEEPSSVTASAIDVPAEVVSKSSADLAPTKASVASTAVASSSKLSAQLNLKYIPIEDFSWDQGSYNSPSISIYIDIPNVGSSKDRVTCNFSRYGFDFCALDVNGKNYRLIKDNLEKDIIPEQSKIIVKKDKVVIKLQKVKGEYSYENWNQLTAKKLRDPVKDAEKKKDPMGGIMDMMKDMYDEGDENMKKIIGEAMLKSQRGEKGDAPKMPDDF